MPSDPRDPWLDNVKMTLVTLVVIGHSWGLLSGTPDDLHAYDFLYFWHIPAFVLVTGYLSRSFVWDRRHLVSLLTTIALPYLIFEPALFYYRSALDQHEGGAVLLVPHWAMWYLPVIFMWRLAAPVLKRHWLWIPASVAISLVGGLSTVPYLGLPRILGLLPFFVLGLHLDKARLDLLRFWWLRPIAIAALVGIFLFAGQIDEWARTAFLLYDAGYADLDWPAQDAMRIRLFVMGIGLLGTLSVLVLVPRRGGWYSQMGSATLVVYLFHGFAVRYGEYAGWREWSGRHRTSRCQPSPSRPSASPWCLPARRYEASWSGRWIRSTASSISGDGQRQARTSSGNRWAPARADGGARQHVVLSGFHAIGSRPAEVCWIPRCLLIWRRPVLGQHLELFQQLGQSEPEPNRPLGEVLSGGAGRRRSEADVY